MDFPTHVTLLHSASTDPEKDDLEEKKKKEQSRVPFLSISPLFISKLKGEIFHRTCASQDVK